jgi:hypothetical protein
MFQFAYKRRRLAPPPPVPQVLPAGLLEEFERKPLALGAGELSVIPRAEPEPAPAQPQGLLIRPWTPEERLREDKRLAAEREAESELTALERLKLAHETFNPPPPEPYKGPPQPLPRFEPPKWTEAERRREAERLAHEKPK